MLVRASGQPLKHLANDADQWIVIPPASSYGTGYRVGEVLALVVLAALAAVLARRAHRRPPGRARTTDALVALVVGVLFVVAAVRFADHRASGPWDTQQGRELRAGFLAGCARSAADAVDCNCMFEHLTSAPPGNTPAGFVTLDSIVNEAASRGPQGLPPWLLESLRSCRVGGS